MSLTERNTAATPNARLSDRLDIGKTDRTPQRYLDHILWQYVHGADSQPPPPGPERLGPRRGRLEAARQAGSAGALDGGDERRAAVRPGPRLLRAAPESWSSRSSRAGGPTTCTFSGRPSSPWKSGSEIAGWPVTFQVAV